MLLHITQHAAFRAVSGLSLFVGSPCGCVAVLRPWVQSGDHIPARHRVVIHVVARIVRAYEVHDAEQERLRKARKEEALQLQREQTAQDAQANASAQSAQNQSNASPAKGDSAS